MTIDRIGIHFGNLFSIHFYGLIIMLGVVAAAALSYYRAKRYGQDPERVLDMLIWVVLAGVIGARVWHVLTPSPSLVAIGKTTEYYFSHPLEALAIWKGGLGIPGAVIGGFIALMIYTRANKLSLATWTDIIAPGLLLAQAIGRWGNYVNQELYGAPTNLPWAIYIDPAHRLPEYANQAYYHPTFLYESLWNVAGVLFLLWLSKRFADKLKPGDIFASYLIIYPVIRILLEFIRLDSSTVAGLNANQTVMVVVMTGAIIYLVWRHVIAPKREVVKPVEVTQE